MISDPRVRLCETSLEEMKKIFILRYYFLHACNNGSR